MSDEHFQRVLRENHEKRLLNSEIEANAAAAELIAERISAKIAEQNDIIYKIGQKQAQTQMIAYLSLLVGGAAAIAQFLGPIWQWPFIQNLFS